MRPSLAQMDRDRQQSRLYHQRWQAFREHGNKPFIVSRSQHPTAWQLWQHYFDLNGLGLQASMMATRSEMTVPCPDPRDFDHRPTPPDPRTPD